MGRNETIEIPFGAKDSELKGWEYTIPEGMEARIEGNKIILEPKESEDERIRKALMQNLKERFGTKGNMGEGLDMPDVLTWLEKQGEHIKFLRSIQIGDEVTRNPDGVLVNLSQFKRKAKQGSQNLANSAKTCKDEQNPAWSEEDEKNIEKLDGFLTEVFCYGHVYVSQKDKEELQSWLKSLKERYTWKPSDEQMELLREVQQALLGKDCHNRFVNFMYELKKLKG